MTISSIEDVTEGEGRGRFYSTQGYQTSINTRVYICNTSASPVCMYTSLCGV